MNTHRPDGFQMEALNITGIENARKKGSMEGQVKDQQMLRLAIRLFRPARPARVRLAGITPKQVVAQGVKGKVMESAGPWKTSGEWWTPTCWMREEWDIALDDGALYRIYRELQSCEWYVHGIYD